MKTETTEITDNKKIGNDDGLVRVGIVTILGNQWPVYETNGDSRSLFQFTVRRGLDSRRAKALVDAFQGDTPVLLGTVDYQFGFILLTKWLSPHRRTQVLAHEVGHAFASTLGLDACSEAIANTLATYLNMTVIYNDEITKFLSKDIYFVPK